MKLEHKQKITPFLWFNDNAEEAINFYTSIFKNSKIKTFKCKHLRIHRKEPGYIHYDGDPVMTGPDIEITLKEKGIRVIVNPYANKKLRKPNAVQNAENRTRRQRSTFRKNAEHPTRLVRGAEIA